MHPMFQGDLDNLVNCQVCTNGSILAPLSNHIGLVSLLAVH